MASLFGSLFGRAEKKLEEPFQPVPPKTQQYDQEYIDYCIELEQTVSALEAYLHTSDDPRYARYADESYRRSTTPEYDLLLELKPSNSSNPGDDIKNNFGNYLGKLANMYFVVYDKLSIEEDVAEQMQYNLWKQMVIELLVDTLLKQFAKEILESLQNLRQYIVAEMTHDDEAEDTDGLLAFNFQGMIENLLVHSLTFKGDGFAEEKEWRLFLDSQAYKLPDWVLGAAKDMQGPRGFSETLTFLRNRIAFNITEDNISPYVPISFDDFDATPIEEIWIGPKSRISECDLKLYLATKGYNNVRIAHSNISYR